VDNLLELARGPLFRLAFALMILGTMRQVILTIIGYLEARKKAGDKNINTGGLAIETIKWLVPFRYVKKRGLYSLTSFLFHIGLVLVPIFFAGHIRLWAGAIGITWPALPGPISDWLALLTVVSGIGLIAGRLWNSRSRALSRFQDWFFTPMIVLVFITGYLAAHPQSSPIGYREVMIVHVLGADLIMLLLPFSKLIHCILLPFSRYVNDMGWRFVSGSGEAVLADLGKEGKPV